MVQNDAATVAPRHVFIRRGAVAALVVATVALAAVTTGCSGTEETVAPSTDETVTPTSQHTAIDKDPAALIQPEDLAYLGAFRLPEGEDDETRTWAWADGSITCNPNGDLSGPDDGFGGSLFGIGHAQQFYVSEIDIPTPVISPNKNVADLETAHTLQGFSDVFGTYIEDFEIPVGAIAYVPARNGQGSDKLHLSWGQWLQYELVPSRAWCETDLASPDTAGTWFLGELDVRGTGDYVFTAPQEWADAYTSGRTLVTGRFKDGGQASQGPTLYAYAPWEIGDPPANGETIPYTTLLAYDIVDEGDQTLEGYEHSDEWLGAEWLSVRDRSAVVFAGTKAFDDQRDTWYGFADGGDAYATPPTDMPDNEKGWWSDRFEGQILFYDPADLAAVATGQAPASSPQPYAIMPIDEYLFNVTNEQQKRHVVGMAFDPERGLLYVVEPFADGDKPIVHVWAVEVE